MFSDKLTLSLPHSLLQHTPKLSSQRSLGLLRSKKLSSAHLMQGPLNSMWQLITSPQFPLRRMGNRATFPGPGLGLSSCYFTGYPMV